MGQVLDHLGELAPPTGSRLAGNVTDPAELAARWPAPNASDRIDTNQAEGRTGSAGTSGVLPARTRRPLRPLQTCTQPRTLTTVVLGLWGGGGSPATPWSAVARQPLPVAAVRGRWAGTPSQRPDDARRCRAGRVDPGPGTEQSSTGGDDGGAAGSGWAAVVGGQLAGSGSGSHASVHAPAPGRARAAARALWLRSARERRPQPSVVRRGHVPRRRSIIPTGLIPSPRRLRPWPAPANDRRRQP